VGRTGGRYHFWSRRHGLLISGDCVQVVSDGTLAHEWSASNADDFGRNQVRFRALNPGST